MKAPTPGAIGKPGQLFKRRLPPLWHAASLVTFSPQRRGFCSMPLSRPRSATSRPLATRSPVRLTNEGLARRPDYAASAGPSAHRRVHLSPCPDWPLARAAADAGFHCRSVVALLMPGARPVSTGPWHRWFPAEWLSSETRHSMSAAARGVYRDALDLCYSEGSIQADEATLRRLLAVSEAAFAEAWPEISRKF